MGKLLITATRRISPAHINYLRPVPVSAAPPAVARVYSQIERDFGMLAPPVALQASSPVVLAACWVMLRETLLTPGPASRERKEAVAAAVSLANRCPYCVDVHGATLVGLDGTADARAVAAGRIAEVADPALAQLAGWAYHLDGPRPRPMPFAAAEAPHLLGVATTFHYINRMVNVFLRESPLPVTEGSLGSVFRRTAERIMGSLGRRRADAGLSLGLLEPAELPADLAWAGPEPMVAEAFARAARAFEASATRAVPGPVREMVLRHLAEGRGGPPGPDIRDWLAEPTEPLAPAHRPAGRLALLTVHASYRVTPGLVAAFRAGDPEDRSLVELVGWSAFAAARHTVARAAAAGPGAVTGDSLR